MRSRAAHNVVQQKRNEQEEKVKEEKRLQLARTQSQSQDDGPRPGTAGLQSSVLGDIYGSPLKQENKGPGAGLANFKKLGKRVIMHNKLTDHKGIKKEQDRKTKAQRVHHLTILVFFFFYQLSHNIF
jgi:hypothetical protein